jgi:hypothetical protein
MIYLYEGRTGAVGAVRFLPFNAMCMRAGRFQLNKPKPETTQKYVFLRKESLLDQ